MDAMVSMPFASSSAAFSTSPNRCICEHVGVMLEIGGGGGSDADQLAEKLVSPDRSGIAEQKREREEKEAPNGPKAFSNVSDARFLMPLPIAGCKEFAFGVLWPLLLLRLKGDVPSKTRSATVVRTGQKLSSH